MVYLFFLADVGIEVTKPETYYYLNQTGVYTVDGTNDTDDYHDLIVTLLLIFYKQISSNKNRFHVTVSLWNIKLRTMSRQVCHWCNYHILTSFVI